MSDSPGLMNTAKKTLSVSTLDPRIVDFFVVTEPVRDPVSRKVQTEMRKNDKKEASFLFDSWLLLLCSTISFRTLTDVCK